ncbi:hypothetical protein Aduo_012375 [Ancylostoma duodenale]
MALVFEAFELTAHSFKVPVRLLYDCMGVSTTEARRPPFMSIHDQHLGNEWSRVQTFVVQFGQLRPPVLWSWLQHETRAPDDAMPLQVRLVLPGEL